MATSSIVLDTGYKVATNSIVLDTKSAYVAVLASAIHKIKGKKHKLTYPVEVSSSSAQLSHSQWPQRD